MAIAVLAIALVVLAFASFLVGTYSMTPDEVVETAAAFLSGSVDDSNRQAVAVMFSIRIPRVLLAAMVGAALAVSGAAYQGVFRNPMVSPDILGVSNAASVGVALGLLLGLIIPHIVRLMMGPNYRSLLPVSMLTGACFMLAVDDVARVLVVGELPVGVLTALIGAPLFIYMLFKGRRQYV